MTDYAYTTWSRLEPRPRSDGMKDGLRASVGDPLWLLSRQWQFKEFQGEDAGSPVGASVTVERDRVTRVEGRGGGRGDPDAPPAGPVDYDGGPLESTVERERVHTAPAGPTARQAAEAGLHFLRTLSAAGYTNADGSAYAAADFPESLHVDDLDGAMPAADRRYLRLMAGRALDGRAVYDAALAGTLAAPAGGSASAAFDDAVAEFTDWYADLYDEPTDGTGAAWRPERMEYAAAVATGADDRERVFAADEYEGGRLDWHAFSLADGESLGATASDTAGDTPVTETETVTTLPTAVRFPGMPSTRFWAFEDSAVSLDLVAGDGGGLSRLVLLSFALEYGNDWFQIPLETPVGTLSTITDLTVTDAFGVTDSAVPAVDDDWSLFGYDLGDDRRGLLLPPTLAGGHESDPVERLLLTRDELANLAFGVERLVEGPTGAPLDRSEFRRPALAITAVRPNDDPALEYVDLENTGDDAYDLAGHALERRAGTSEVVHAFGDVTLPAGGTVRVFTGSVAEALGTRGVSDVVGAGLSAGLWADAGSVVVRESDAGTDPGAGRVVASRLLDRAPDALADYRLVGDLPDHWFPLVPEGQTGGRLARGLLLDADTLGLDPTEIPRPLGKLLAPDRSELPPGEDNLRLYEEEVPRSGRAVTRRYQLARWADGRTYLWSGRRAGVGRGETASGLAFDGLAERSG